MPACNALTSHLDPLKISRTHLSGNSITACAKQLISGDAHKTAEHPEELADC